MSYIQKNRGIRAAIFASLALAALGYPDHLAVASPGPQQRTATGQPNVFRFTYSTNARRILVSYTKVFRALVQNSDISGIVSESELEEIFSRFSSSNALVAGVGGGVVNFKAYDGVQLTIVVDCNRPFRPHDHSEFNASDWERTEHRATFWCD